MIYCRHRPGVAAVDYTLMHKEIPVIEMTLDEATGAIQRVGAAFRLEHLPVGISVKKGSIADRAALNTWWIDRSIPASRSGVQRALEVLKLDNTQMLLTRCFGLSLSDQYWVKPKGSGLQWKQVNFFTNPFSEDIGDVLLGKAARMDGFDFRSPDNTSDRFLKKRWKIVNGKRCLLKAGSAPYMQQPFNEVIASAVARRLGIPHVPYTLIWDEDIPYSVCEDFITPDTELVSAWRVMQTMKRDNSTSLYRHYVNCCNALGIPDIVHSLDQMITLDYLIANEDRHQNNFGLVRDANTLEWLGAAPIFDSGSSLGYDKLSSAILAGKGVECKPFKRTHEEQLKLVTSFDWVDPDCLYGLEDEIRGILDQAGEYMEPARTAAICTSTGLRAKRLIELAHEQAYQIDNRSQDLELDIAADYGMKLDM